MARKRRAPNDRDDDDEDSTKMQTQSTGRRRRSPSGSDEDRDGDAGTDTQDVGTLLEQLVKKMVRMALSCEYARIPIRRADISAKVLETHSRHFRHVFEEAQVQLRNVFGMEMVEQPLKEKVTVQQRRAAQKQEKPTGNSNSWILTSILPKQYQIPNIVLPPMVPTTQQESEYVGLYTFIVTVILLSGGQLPEAKLERHLRRVNADQSTPVDKTDKLLQRMIKEGYIVRIKDTSSGEEQIDYMVGLRGKVEIGEEGAASLVKSVYGSSAETEDLEKRLERSLGLKEKREAAVNAMNGTQTNRAESSKRRGRPRKTDANEEADDDADDE